MLADLRLMIRSILVSCWTGEIGGSLAIQNARGIQSIQPIHLCQAAFVAHQAAGCRKLPILVDGRYVVPSCQHSELFSSAREQRIRADYESADP